MGRALTTDASLKHSADLTDRNGLSHLRNRAFIALGGNLGDRVAEIEKACNLMDASGVIRVIRTSGLWETKAMYVIDQNNFLNGVCEIRTSLGPIALLDRLQAIENELGRKKIIDKGPRNIDLDILLYNNDKIIHPRLEIPHKLMLERGFVLQPLAELIPNERLPHAPAAGTVLDHLASLQLDASITPHTPLAPSLPTLAALDSRRKTHVMSILNLTPDSFSDGGQHDATDLNTLKATVLSHIASGATIIDIGGQSSRPHAEDISAAEEIARVVPAIKFIRSLPEASNVAISIDTYRSEVAKAAVGAGADIINDISAGNLDDAMLPTMAELGVTVCFMHMRGTPHTMTSKENTSYDDGMIPTIAKELLERVAAAESAGVRRWRIILDPGIGFAKNQLQNLELLRRLGELREFPGLRGLPWLVGTSRKGFIGKITGVKEAHERTWGTAATVTAAVQGGAEIVRVHDVAEMAQVAKMADAIWRV